MQKLFQSRAKLGQNLPILGQYLANNQANTWPGFGQVLACIWPKPDQILAKFCLYLSSILSSTSQVFCQVLVKYLTKY